MNFLNNQATSVIEGRVWDDIPRLGLVTGRDMTSISWMAAKIVASSVAPRSDSLYGPVLVRPHDGLNLVATPKSAISGGPDLRDIGTILDGDGSVAALAIYTHGSEACAKAEDGIVFCGRSTVASSYTADQPGILACGRSDICPRGPRPTPTARLAKTLLMAACNGLRLADSINHTDFNFALAFVDGPGIAYTSTLTSTSGAGPATVAYLASLADGHDIGSAVVAANTIPLLANVADPAFISVGDVFHRPIGDRRPPKPIEVEELPVTIDAGNHHTAVLRCSARSAIELFRDGELGISASGLFCRPFAVSRMSGARSEGLEIRLYSFPEPLGTVSITGFSIAHITEIVKSLFREFDSWIAYWQRLRLGETAPEIFNELVQADLETRTSLAEKIAQLRWSGHLQQAIRDQIDAGYNFLALIAAESIDLLSANLSGPFWLTNELASDYLLIESLAEPCPHCEGSARRRRLKHSILDNERDTVVCGRCGIIFDGPLAGPRLRLSLDQSKPIRADDDLTVRIEIDTQQSNDAATLALGLTMPGQKKHGFAPAVQEIRATDSKSDFLMKCRLDRDVAPHRYYVKALLGTPKGISFYSAPFFVCPGDAE
ncbi:hypothetical protein [Xanthobacter sp.]|uniref:hypothetical protein n=1 Tax=Xanthobacter sp. TaxID=35809 RepID=UPI0025E5F6EF|nr:hypothetical protein [Xanthobacter sp.]